MWQQTGWESGIDIATVFIPKAWKQQQKKPLSLPQMADFWWRIWLFIHSEAPAPVLASFQSVLDLLQKMTQWHASYGPDETGWCASTSALVWTTGGCKLPKTSDVEIVWLTVKEKKAQLTSTKSSVRQYSISCSSFPHCFTAFPPDECCSWSDFTIVHTGTFFLIAHPCSSREGMGHF